MRIIPQNTPSLFDGKTCWLCGQWKPLTDYYRCKTFRDGLQRFCKECSNQRFYQYAKNNPQRQNITRQKYRHRKNNSIGSYTYAEWKSLCQTYGSVCACCGAAEPLCADHIVPLSKGGTSYISNIQPLCRTCNSRKGSQTIDYRK